MTLLPRLLVCLLCPSALLPAADYFPPPDSEGGWRTVTGAKEIREKAGMDLERLENAYKATERSTANGGLLVVRRGYLVFEKYFGRACSSWFAQPSATEPAPSPDFP